MHLVLSTQSIIGFIVGLLCLSSQAEKIYYVDQNASGPIHDGSSWCNACTDLSEALDNAVAGDVIRVAEGIYLPSTDGLTDPREATFQLISGVTLEGGYAGCGSASPDERDIEVYETILSGDLDGVDQSNCCITHGSNACDDDACTIEVCSRDGFCCTFWSPGCVLLAEEHCDNLCETEVVHVYHVVTGSGVDTTAVIDGFTITKGMATGPDFQSAGGGMLNNAGSPTVINSKFSENLAVHGGGIYNFATLPPSTSNPVIYNCQFDNNFATSTGGGMENVRSDAIVSNSVFLRNSMTDRGGGVYNFYSNTTFTYCIFESNTSALSGHGGAMYNVLSTTKLSGCTFKDNDSVDGGGVISENMSYTEYNNCLFTGNDRFAILDTRGQAVVNNCIFYNNNIAIRTGFSQLSVTNSLFINNINGEAIVSGGDLGTIISNSTFFANPFGAAAHGAGSSTLKNCIIWNVKGPPIRDGLKGQVFVEDSAIEGGWPGPGNLSLDPRFVDPIGLDGIPGTLDDDLRLQPSTPYANLGDPAFDLNANPVDLDGELRIEGCRVDWGAYETGVIQTHGDFDSDLGIDLADMASLQRCFGARASNSPMETTCVCVFDFNDDDVVNLEDLSKTVTRMRSIIPVDIAD